MAVNRGKERDMYKLLFETKAEKTLESVNDALLKETGNNDFCYESMEDIERSEREGFLEFEDGCMRVYADM